MADDMTVNIMALYRRVTKYIQEQDIGCPETIYQCDHVQLTALNFIKELCDIVGYAPQEEDNDT